MNPLIPIVIEALILTEGRGLERNIRNDAEDAVGVLQIRPCVVADLNRWGYPFSLKARWDGLMSRSMARLYLAHYVDAAEGEAGRALDAGEIAKIWNGGPKAWKYGSAGIVDYARMAVQYMGIVLARTKEIQRG